MTQLSLFGQDIWPARQVRSDIRFGDAAEAFVIAKLLMTRTVYAAMRLMTLALISERGGIAAFRSKGERERIKGNGIFALFGEIPGPGPAPTPTQPQTSTSPRASRCRSNGSRFSRACTPQSG
jgi:hypothetical protein